MFSLAISSIRSRWRPSSRPMMAATSGSAASRLSFQKWSRNSAELVLMISRILRSVGQLVDAALVAPAGKIRGEKGFNTGSGHVWPYKASAHGNGIGVIMLAAQACRYGFGHQSTAGGRIAVYRNRNAYTAAAQGNAALCLVVGKGLGEQIAVVRIIDRVRAVRTQIRYLMTEFGKPASKIGFKRESGVV